jgi:hypothetical protein
MPSKFLHLGISFRDKSPTPEVLKEVENVLNKAKDWYRYAPNCWIIYTGQTPRNWHDRLKTIPWLAAQQYLIVEINMNERSGWLPKDTWNWITKDRP